MKTLCAKASSKNTNIAHYAGASERAQRQTKRATSVPKHLHENRLAKNLLAANPGPRLVRDSFGTRHLVEDSDNADKYQIDLHLTIL